MRKNSNAIIRLYFKMKPENKIIIYFKLLSLKISPMSI